MTYSKADLAKIVAAHGAWFRGEANGARANLSGADLSGVDLIGTDLSGADLIGADLSNANLIGADLSNANLIGADLIGTNLSGTNLSNADLCGANLSGANLSRADLSGADLSGTNLSRANLCGANLCGANLSGTNLSRANLSGCKFNDKTIWPDFQIVPEAGPFWLWKKLREGIVAQLEVPAAAARVSSTGRKCRVEYATVLALFGADGVALAPDAVGLSKHDDSIKYRAGQVVRPDKYDPDFREECSSGIHGFLRRKEAEEYV